MSTRAQRFSMAARMTEHWLERLEQKKKLTPLEKRALANFLKVLRELIKEIV